MEKIDPDNKDFKRYSQSVEKDGLEATYTFTIKDDVLEMLAPLSPPARTEWATQKDRDH